MTHPAAPNRPPATCDEVRALLLDHVYGALDDAESAAVESHVAACAPCRDALAAARAQQSVLAEAARAEAGDVTFQAPRREVPIFRPLFAAAAAASLLVGVGAIGHVSTERTLEIARNPVLEVTGPQTVVAGLPAEFRVHAATLDGAPVVANVRATVTDAKGVETEVGAVALDATTREATLALGKLALAPGEQKNVRFQFVGGASVNETVDLPLRDATRLVSRVSTDKPLYRPGETVRLRAIALDGLRLTPAGDSLLRLRLFDPRGGVAFDATLPTATGVTAWQQALAADAPGGTWRAVVSAPEGAASAVALSEQRFQVRAFRAPRLRFDSELDRDSYRPGDRGTAFVTVRRAEGGIPAGAKAEFVLRVDGNEAVTETITVGADGGVAVPFTVPEAVEQGVAQFSLTVHDGGVVETTAKTVPLVTGIVRFETFPEGGTLVAGLANRVYFRARTPADEPADVDVEIRDLDGRVAARAKTDTLGMGAFEMTPRAGATYAVVFADSGKPVCEGSTFDAAADGVTLRTLAESVPARGAVPVRIGSTSGGRYTVGAWCRGVPVGETTVDVRPGATADARIRIRTDAGGVLRVTAFDADGVPVAERLVAREPARKLSVAVAPQRAKTAPRERQKVTLKVRDETGRAAGASILGAAVVDQSVISLADDRATTPLPLHFLLGMEVKDIEKADLFGAGTESARAVDLLLGVQGWRRFAWKDAKAFAQANPEVADRVGAVGSDDVPNAWTNRAEAESAVAWAEDSARDDVRGAVVGLAFLAVLAGGLWVGIRGLVARRRGVSIGGFAAAGVPVILFGLMVVSSGVQERMSALAPGAAVFTAAAELADASAPPSGGAWEVEESKLEPGEKVLLDLDGDFPPTDETRVLEVLEEERALGEADARVRLLREFAAEGKDKKAAEGLDAATIAAVFLRSRDEPVGGKDGIVVDWDAAFQTPEWRRNAVRVLVREYAHTAAPRTDGARNDLTDVLYWNPLLVTDDRGEASFEFDTSDAITAFRVAAEAHDGRGALGAGEASFSNRVPFWAEPKFPTALTAGDEVDLPLVVANDADFPLNVRTTASVDGALLTLNGAFDTTSAPPLAAATWDVAAGARSRTLVPLMALQGRGTGTFTFTALSSGARDAGTRKIDVLPRGYPIVVDRSGVLEKADQATLVLPDALNRATLRGSLTLYPSMVATLVEGMDDMLQEPGGCFEQASSSNYPNVMVLNLLQEQGAAEPAVARRAKDMLGRGYKLLTGYECRRKGYEWFGSDPGHEALTAYGLLEFADMAKVFDVDASMVGRTRDWLMSRRDGKGGFLRDAKALDSFGGAPEPVTQAYVTWALSEADAATDLSAELGALEARAAKSDDPYLVALAALASKNRSRPAAAALLERLAGQQKSDGSFAGKTTSITSSEGANLDVETTALAVLAFAKDPSRLAKAESAVRWLLARRQGGGFGATQATILSLRALTAHAKASRRTACDHDLQVLVNGVPVAKRFVSKGEAGAVEIERELLDALVPGENTVELRTSGGEALPWSLRIEYSTTLPANDPGCAVAVTTSLDRHEADEGGTVDLAVTVTNRRDAGVPMTIARVGVPAGLEPRAARLDELKKAGAIDFYELRPLEVTLYWRGLAPKAERKVTVELTASIPGRYESPASSAYLYYADDAKSWAAPVRCAVRAAR